MVPVGTPIPDMKEAAKVAGPQDRLRPLHEVVREDIVLLLRLVPFRLRDGGAAGVSDKTMGVVTPSTRPDTTHHRLRRTTLTPRFTVAEHTLLL